MLLAMLLVMLLAGATHASYADDAETVTPTAAVATDTVAVVKTALLQNGTQVQIRDILRADAGQHVVRAAIFDGATWWQSDVGPDVPSGDCGMGKCVDQRLVATKISRADGIVWIRYIRHIKGDRVTTMATRGTQLELDVRRPGTRAPGDGRPKKRWPKGTKAPASHVRREAFVKGRALHVTLRTLPVARNLRRMDAYRAVRIAARVVLARSEFRLVHFSIQSNHIHLIVEAESRVELANGVRAFSISVAKSLNAKLDRRGPVFADRYHAQAIAKPTQMRNAIQYVLTNWLHHRPAHHELMEEVDPYSSGADFLGWKELGATRQFVRDDGFERVPLSTPVLWLTREGWKRGGEISVFTVPG